MLLMLSLYLHIPFCQSKCKYCAFSTFPMEEKADHIERYLQALEKEMQAYAQLLSKPALKTIYVGGGTPNLLGAEKLVWLVEKVMELFDCSELAELSFEFNPYPEEEIYEIIKAIQKKRGKTLSRIRFSFGIQSFDNEVLQLSGRKTLFLGLVDFLRGLQALKQDSTVFNFDFIAFGKRNQSKKGNRYLWTPAALEFFEKLVNSQFADSFSLYTLELFENQMRKRKNSEKLISGEFFGTDEDIYEEFSLLKSLIADGGYQRYELSNFALAGKSSIHNRVYREMEDYLGVGLNSASFLNAKSLNADLLSHFGLDPEQTKNARGLRFKNTVSFEQYLTEDFLDPSAFEILDEKDYLIEEFFLSLRTDRGISNLSKYEKILVPNFQSKLESYEQQGFILPREDGFVLTDEGMDVFNAILTDILEEI